MQILLRVFIEQLPYMVAYLTIYSVYIPSIYAGNKSNSSRAITNILK